MKGIPVSTFVHHNEPYGTVVFAVQSVTPCVMPSPRGKGDSYLAYRAEHGYLDLRGTVVRGKETSRLFHATATRDLRGQPYSLAVTPAEYARGFKRTIAM